MTTRTSMIVSLLIVALMLQAKIAKAVFIDPTSISGNVLWLDGADADGNGTTGGGLVGGSTWVDKSSVGVNDAIQLTASFQPTVAAGAINSLPAVRFDGVDNYLSNNAVNYDARTIFTVFRASSATQPTTELAQLWGEYGAGVHVAIEPRAGANQFGFSFDGNLSASTTARYSLGANPFTGLVANGNPQTWAYDAVELVSVEFNANKTVTDHHISSLLSALGGHHFGGDIAEIIIYDRLLTIDAAAGLNEFNDVQFYLQEKWGLGLGLQATPPVPEPSTFLLLGLGALGLVRHTRRRRRRA